ncbi:protein of unknown function [Burkholderia multivorans]
MFSLEKPLLIQPDVKGIRTLNPSQRSAYPNVRRVLTCSVGSNYSPPVAPATGPQPRQCWICYPAAGAMFHQDIALGVEQGEAKCKIFSNKALQVSRLRNQASRRKAVPDRTSGHPRAEWPSLTTSSFRPDCAA